MKKLLLFLLISVSVFGQSPQNFPYGIRNTGAGVETNPAWIITSQTDNIYRKTSPLDLPIPNKVQDSLDAIRADIPTPLGYTPENVANKITAISGGSTTEYPSEKAVVDYVGSKTSKVYANVVYVNTTNPTTATIFDLANPPVTNDNSLKANALNLYIGTDTSTWAYNGTSLSYETETVPSTSNFFLTGGIVDAGSNKTSLITRTGPIQLGSYLTLSRSSSSTNTISIPFITLANTFPTLGNGTSTFNKSGMNMTAGNGAVSYIQRANYDSDFSGALIGTSTNHRLRFTTNGTNRMDIMAGGNVLIGKITDASDGLLQVNGNITASQATLGNQVVTKAQLDLKQNTLVSGTNINTVNGSSLLGSGNVAIGLQSVTAGTNKNLVNGMNFQGTGAGVGSTGADNSNFLGEEAGNGAVNPSDSNFLGFYSGKNSSDSDGSNYLGANSGLNANNCNNSNYLGSNSGNGATDSSYSNFLGQSAGINSVGASDCNFFGNSAGQASTGNHVNAFGPSAGYGNSLSGQTIFSNDCLPSFVNRAAALLVITVPLGASSGSTYLYYNETTFAIEAIRL